MSVADLEPAGEAADFARQMLEARETMETILEETLESAERGRLKESGRTACGSAADVRHPIARFPESVELQTCPRGLVGVWHTHVTEDELLHPDHSLPDLANVAFGAADISIVVGARTADAVVAAADREAMERAFQDALDVGPEVGSTEDVVVALQEGLVEDPQAARSRVREALGPLQHRADTGFDSIAARVRTEPEVPQLTMATIPCGSHRHHRGGHGRPATGAVTRAPERLRQQARACGTAARQGVEGSGISIRELVIGQTLGTIVGTLTSRIVFGGG